MTARKRQIVIGAAAVVLTLSLAVMLWMPRPGAQEHVSVSFDGFTNLGPQKLAARFLITNGTAAEVYFEILSLERHSGETWGPTAFDPDHLPTWLLGGSRLSGPLPRGERRAVLLPVPFTNAAYRVRYAQVERRTGTAGVRDRVREVYNRLIRAGLLKEQSATRIFLGERYELISAESSP
jgi:hypothetical protein